MSETTTDPWGVAEHEPAQSDIAQQHANTALAAAQVAGHASEQARSHAGEGASHRAHAEAAAQTATDGAEVTARLAQQVQEALAVSQQIMEATRQISADNSRWANLFESAVHSLLPVLESIARDVRAPRKLTVTKRGDGGAIREAVSEMAATEQPRVTH